MLIILTPDLGVVIKEFFMKLLIVFSTVLLFSNQVMALNSKEILDCFEKAVNEKIVENKHSDGNKVTRICDELSTKDKDKFISRFSKVKNGKLAYYSSESMNEWTLRNIYDVIKNDMSCYGNKSKHGGFLGLANTFSYHRNLDLTSDALGKMAGAEELWDVEHTKIKDLDLSYCQQ